MRTALAEHQQPAPRKASTLMLHVPRVDWTAVSTGVKTQWRSARNNAPRYNTPRPVVLQSQSALGTEPETCLAVLEDVHREPLGAISPEDLAAEGMASLAEFRSYWKQRHNYSIGFQPLTIVTVFSVRLWRDGDREFFADVLLEHLYGPWL
jgi:hypothetical protein